MLHRRLRLQGHPQRPETALQRQQNHIAFRYQLATKLQCRKHSRWHLGEVPGFLRAITPHRHLANPVRNALELEPKPDLLAIGTPSVKIAIKRDAYGTLRLPKQAQIGLGIGRSIDAIQLRHRVPSGVVERAVAEAREFFARGAEHKRAIDYSQSPAFRGYMAVGVENTAGRCDHREQLEIAAEGAPLSVTKESKAGDS